MTTPFSRIGAKKRAAGLPADRLPPGQYIPRSWPVLHYGPVPRFKPDSWDLRVYGETDAEAILSWDEVRALPTADVTADFHCVTKFSVLDNTWTGIPTSVVLERHPPLPTCTHVMVWAEYGYSANVRLSDFASPQAMLVTHRNGEPLTPDHGYPLRLVVPHLYAWKSAKWVRGIEFLSEDRRGFWEDRGYHNVADPWTEQRYSYQEQPGDGPPL